MLFNLARNTNSVIRLLSINKSFTQSFTATHRQYSAQDPIRGRELQLSYLTDDDKQGIAIVGLNRPKARNSFSKSLVRELLDAIDVLTHDKNVRVVILRSLVPDIFCAGADLKERATMTPQDVGRFVAKLRQMMSNIEQIPAPVIAAIDGPALGGGLEMALACDMRIVASSIKLGLVETKLGIIPGAGGTQRLPRILNPAVAKELIFTARQITGEEAKSLGIANYAVQQNKLGDAAFQKALELAGEIVPNGPVGVRMAKKAIDRGLQVDLATGCAIEEACYAQVIPTRDRMEGLKAFAEKRKPKFIGE
ncbi:methylglutaconyl-CoA hydratase, mitochondrial [Toxorhynchites rutilus septentrionalis]|uniref:methylglutaconyl-CoA hydratase, mitochondrial n=1 Tax=Toxorhynchites rutilus septentrionalis TaxID=329112 RepID=UPI00247838C3|nr:methylglutaconyl-CoA hydratase, mitochondrial [Toxorhynchites rutilus septentrionalis]